MRSRRSTPIAAWSGRASGSGAVRSHSSAGMGWVAKGGGRRSAEGKPVRGHIHGNAEEPGVEGRLPAKRAERLKGSNERVLSAIPCLLAIAQHLEGQAPHALPILFHQRLEGRDISGTTALDEGGLVQVLGSRRNVTFRRR